VSSVDKQILIYINIKYLHAMKNRVQLIGHVGQDPEVKSINDKKVANLTLATNEHYTNAKGEKVEQTEWHKITAWGKTAELIEKYVVKGKEIAIEGKLSHRSYDDKDGNKRYVTEILVNELLLLGK
jgi:single-strand DNA-binding protein